MSFIKEPAFLFTWHAHILPLHFVKSFCTSSSRWPSAMLRDKVTARLLVENEHRMNMFSSASLLIYPDWRSHKVHIKPFGQPVSSCTHCLLTLQLNAFLSMPMTSWGLISLKLLVLCYVSFRKQTDGTRGSGTTKQNAVPVTTEPRLVRMVLRTRARDFGYSLVVVLWYRLLVVFSFFILF